MKQILFLFSLILMGCSPKFSKHFKQTQYERKDGVKVSNSEVGFSFIAFGDIDHFDKKHDIRKEYKSLNLEISGDILVYGKTSIDPSYDYFVTVSNSNAKVSNDNIEIEDTIINGKLIQFIGIPKSEEYRRNVKSDLKRMFSSLEVEY